MRNSPLTLLMLCLSLLSSVCLTSCGNNGCEQTRETFLYSTVKSTGRTSINSMNVWAIDLPADSLMLVAPKPTELEFILKPDTTDVRFRLEMLVNDNGDLFQYNDTLSVSYEATPYFLDMECGCSMFFTLHDVSVTNNVFKKILLKNKAITNELQINIALEY